MAKELMRSFTPFRMTLRVRFVTEFIPSVPSGQALSQKSRPFTEFILSEANGFRVTRRRVQDNNIAFFQLGQSLRGERR